MSKLITFANWLIHNPVKGLLIFLGLNFLIWIGMLKVACMVVEYSFMGHW